jgi:hypothetical protein
LRENSNNQPLLPLVHLHKAEDANSNSSVFPLILCINPCFLPAFYHAQKQMISQKSKTANYFLCPANNQTSQSSQLAFETEIAHNLSLYLNQKFFSPCQ